MHQAIYCLSTHGPFCLLGLRLPRATQLPQRRHRTPDRTDTPEPPLSAPASSRALLIWARVTRSNPESDHPTDSPGHTSAGSKSPDNTPNQPQQPLNPSSQVDEHLLPFI